MDKTKILQLYMKIAEQSTLEIEEMEKTIGSVKKNAWQ